MKLIKQSYEIIEPTGYTLNDIYKSIELAGRCSYKSEDKITEDSAEKFVQRLINSRHFSPLEFGTVYLAMPMETILPITANGWGKYTKNPYSKGFKVCEVNGERRVAITTNLRALYENQWNDDLQYLCEPTEYHERRYTVKFTLPISISREFVRHRAFSFMEMSTRYVRMSKKFGDDIIFIKPHWCISNELQANSILDIISKTPKDGYAVGEELLYNSLLYAEKNYKELLDKGLKPQEAREVLPLCTKTELFMCGYKDAWKNFFELRDSKNAHPMAYELAHNLHKEFKNRNLI